MPPTAKPTCATHSHRITSQSPARPPSRPAEPGLGPQLPSCSSCFHPCHFPFISSIEAGMIWLQGKSDLLRSFPCPLLNRGRAHVLPQHPASLFTLSLPYSWWLDRLGPRGAWPSPRAQMGHFLKPSQHPPGPQKPSNDHEDLGAQPEDNGSGWGAGTEGY